MSGSVEHSENHGSYRNIPLSMGRNCKRQFISKSYTILEKIDNMDQMKSYTNKTSSFKENNDQIITQRINAIIFLKQSMFIIVHILFLQ